MTTREKIGYIVIFVSALPIIIVRIINLDMTGLHVFVDYWYLAALALAGIITGGVILRKEYDEQYPNNKRL